MIILGVVLIVLALLVAKLSVLLWIGIALVVVGLVVDLGPHRRDSPPRVLVRVVPAPRSRPPTPSRTH